MATVQPVEPSSRPASPRQALSRLGLSATRIGDEVVVRLSGALDTYTANRARSYLGRYDPATERVVLDLTAVRLLDSKGLRLLAALATRAELAGMRLRIVAPERIRRLLEIGGVAGPVEDPARAAA